MCDMFRTSLCDDGHTVPRVLYHRSGTLFACSSAVRFAVQVGPRYSAIFVSASSDIVPPFCGGTNFEPKTKGLQRGSWMDVHTAREPLPPRKDIM